MIAEINTKAYYPRTTLKQRLIAAKSYLSFGILEAVIRSGMNKDSVYRWVRRFLEFGEEGLKDKKRTNKPHNFTIQEIESKILKMHEDHKDWGKQMIADQLKKENNWKPVCSPNTVRAVLMRHNKWHPEDHERVKKRKKKQKYRTPDTLGQTACMDLLFVPSIHVNATAPPKEGVKTEQENMVESQVPPECVVKDTEKKEEKRKSYSTYYETMDTAPTYEHGMMAYANRKSDKSGGGKEQTVEEKAKQERLETITEGLAALQTALEKSRIEKREAQIVFKNEKKEWKAFKRENKRWQAEWKQLNRNERKVRNEEAQAWKRSYREHLSRWRRAQHENVKNIDLTKVQHKILNKQMDALKAEKAGLLGDPPVKRTNVSVDLFAILLVMDVKNRKVLILEPFYSGKNVTAEEILEALKQKLPKGFKFVISDNGANLVADKIQEFYAIEGIVNVRIPPRYPRANSLAERCVKTMKARLWKLDWETVEEFWHLVPLMKSEYNDRPHQGLVGHLSPNEYTSRFGCQFGGVSSAVEVVS